MEDLVTYEQAVKLKELGFDWECYQYYNDDEELWTYTSMGYGDDCRNWNDKDYAAIGNAKCSAPTLAQVQKWLRVRASRQLILNVGFDGQYYWYICQPDGTVIDGEDESITYQTYEQALSACIDKSLELLKEK